VKVDDSAPVSTLTVTGPSAGAYMSEASTISLSSFDPFVSASGVSLASYSVNGAASITGAPPLAIRLNAPDGLYRIAFQAFDHVGNAELIRDATYYLDSTRPLTEIHFSAPFVT